MVHEITAELNDDQYKLYQVLEEHDLSIGEAIELIFYLREQYGVRNDQLLEDRLEQLINKKKEIKVKMESSDADLSDELDKLNLEMEVIEKLKDTAYDFETKEKILEQEYASIDETYEMKVQAHKRGIKWGKFFNALR